MKTTLLVTRIVAILATALALLPATALAQAGLPLWTNRYTATATGADYFRAVAVDAGGNILVTGGSEGSGTGRDYATIKYSNGGVALWTNRYNGPGNGIDEANALVVDANSNIIVTGYSLGVGTNYEDYLTIKYSNAGVPLWTKRYIGPSSSDWAKAVAADSNGNVYVTGYSMDAANQHWEYATIKYSSAGIPLWTNRYNRNAVATDPCGLAVDAGGNVYVAGSVTYENVFLLAYSSAGTPLWTNSTSSDFLRFSAMALAPDGTACLTGWTSDSYGYRDFITIKYSNAGVALWTNRYNGPGNRYDEANSIAMDGVGNVYVAGESQSTNYDYAIIKYSSAGSPEWTNRYDGPVNGTDAAYAIALDGKGHVIVTGESTGDIATIAYSSAGVPLWTNRYDRDGGHAFGRSLTVDSSGNVFVAGSSSGGGGTFDYDYVIIKYAGMPLAAPAILIHPLTRTNVTGTTATFSVTATGDPPLSFQWRKGGTSLQNDGRVSGVTTTELVIANVQPGDAGDYTVAVTNFVGSVTSLVAQLTIISPGRFSNFAYSPVNGLSFVFRDATLGRPYRIQTSPTLADDSWVDWVSFNYIGPIGLTDFSALENTNKFYRALTP